MMPNDAPELPMEGIIMQRLAIVSLFAVLFLAAVLSLSGCGTAQPEPSEPTSRGELPSGPKKTDFDAEHPTVVLATSLGDITVELDPKAAPITVDNFLAYVNHGQYDGTLFHQVIADYMALAGGYDTEFKERRTEFPIRNEAHNGLKNVRGSIAMARAQDAIDSATSQFFFNLADNTNLDHKDRTPEGYGYCVFGKVIGGLDVLDKINRLPVTDRPNFPQAPAEAVVIRTARQIR
jgi:peptidyl-prolyl cis-trans isomerase B (cyclophilin B)